MFKSSSSIGCKARVGPDVGARVRAGVCAVSLRWLCSGLSGLKQGGQPGFWHLFVGGLCGPSSGTMLGGS